MAGVIDIRDRLARAVREAFKVPEKDAQIFAQGFVTQLAAEFGGGDLYLSKRSMTDAEILTMFDGSNADEVCKAAGITRRTLRTKLRQAEDASGSRKPDPPDPPPKRTVSEDAPFPRRRRRRGGK